MLVVVATAVVAIAGLLVGCSQTADPKPPSLTRNGWTREMVAPAATDDPIAAIDGAVGRPDRWLLYGRYQRRAGGPVVPMVWTSTDGKGWRQRELVIDSPLGQPDGRVTDVELSPNGEGLAVGAIGAGDRSRPVAWTTGDGGDTWSDPELLPQPTGVGGMQANAAARTTEGDWFAVGGPAEGTDGGKAAVWVKDRDWERIETPGVTDDVIRSLRDLLTVPAGLVGVGDAAGNVGSITITPSPDGASPRATVSGSSPVLELSSTPRSVRTPTAVAGAVALGDGASAVVVRCCEDRPKVFTQRDGGPWTAMELNAAMDEPSWPTSVGGDGQHVVAVGRSGSGAASVSGTGSASGPASGPGLWRLAAGSVAVTALPDGAEVVRAEDAALEATDPQVAVRGDQALVVVPTTTGWQALTTSSVRPDAALVRVDVGGLPATRRSAHDVVHAAAGTDAAVVAVGARVADDGASEGRLWLSTDGTAWSEHHMADLVVELTAIAPLGTGLVAVGLRRIEDGARTMAPAVYRSNDGRGFETVARAADAIPVPEGRLFVPSALARRGTGLVMAGQIIDLPGGGRPAQELIADVAEQLADSDGEAALFTSDDAAKWTRVELPAIDDVAPGSLRLGAACGIADEASVAVAARSQANPDEHFVGRIDIDGSGGLRAVVGSAGVLGAVEPVACARTLDVEATLDGRADAGTIVRTDLEPRTGSTEIAAPLAVDLPIGDEARATGTAVAWADGTWLAGGAGLATVTAAPGCRTPRVWASGDGTQFAAQLTADGLLRGTGCGEVGAVTRWRGTWVVLATIAGGVVAVRGP